MAVTMAITCYSIPQTLQPIQAVYANNGLHDAAQACQSSLYVDSALWAARAAHSLKLASQPQLLLPDINEERMFEIDGVTLAAFRPFEAYSGSSFLSPSEQPTPQPSSCVQPVGRRQSAPSAGQHTITSDKNLLPLPSRIGGPVRRRSAPSLIQVDPLSRLGSLDGYTLVAPIRLNRPSHTLRSLSGTEIWWPARSNGSIAVHFFISSWAHPYPEKLVRSFDLTQTQAAAQDLGMVAAGSRPDGSTVSCLVPGAVLPIPGETPAQDIAPRRRFSLPSPHTATASVPMSGRKTYQNEFSAEIIDNNIAGRYLPILGAILTQSKRPIKQSDKVLLPLPFPSAWPETVRYIATMDAEYLSEAVKGNIANLGGRA